MAFQVRPATRDDAAAIAYVHVASWRTTYRGIVPDAALDALDEDQRRGQWQGWIEAGAVPILVAESEAGVVGFIAGGAIRTRTEDYDGELYAIYLMPGEQRLGAGRALVRELAGALRLRGLRSMLVWVLEANPAVGFYRRLGAEPVMSKTVEIGGVTLPEVALGWRSLEVLLEFSAAN
jgi:ribosomal protein S18 acetylase RimI-like enzyme